VKAVKNEAVFQDRFVLNRVDGLSFTRLTQGLANLNLCNYLHNEIRIGVGTCANPNAKNGVFISSLLVCPPFLQAFLRLIKNSGYTPEFMAEAAVPKLTLLYRRLGPKNWTT
jgi:hypothetical protein